MGVGWRQKTLQIAPPLATVAVIVVSLYFLVTSVARFLSSLDQPLIVAIIAASVTVFTSTITVVVGRILERKAGIETHFRQQKYDQYDEMLSIIYGMMDGNNPPIPSEDNVKRLREWQRKLILFAGPKTIRAFVKWMSRLKAGQPTVQTVLLMEEFFQSLRADLGISNFGIQKGDFAHLILKHGDLFVAAAKNNPNMPLTELAALEKMVEERQKTSPPS